MATGPNRDACQADLKKMLNIFKDRDVAIRNGIFIDGFHFDVHRFYDTLIYGRRGDSETGEGVAIVRTKRTSNPEQWFFVLVTYGFPTVSSHAVTYARDFAAHKVAPTL